MDALFQLFFTFLKLNSISHDVYTFMSNTHGIIFLYTETCDTFSVLF